MYYLMEEYHDWQTMILSGEIREHFLVTILTTFASNRPYVIPLKIIVKILGAVSE